MVDDKPEGRPLSGSAFARTARLASLPVGFAGRTTLGVGKRIVGAPAQAVIDEVQRRTADQIFTVLGQLKGGAMKFGQAMSIFEAALPDELIGPYRETLTKLQDSAPPMPPGVVHRVMVEEFGENWRDQFPTFGDVPAASASIGQVHRATWLDGTEVAVKIQYPGAAKALTADLRQIARMARLFGILAPALDVKPLIAELQDRVAEELDYSLEAGAQSVFAGAFADDPEVVIPEPLAHTERALVSEWLEADSSLAQIIATGTQEERDRYGEAYVRFLFAGPERAGMLHADPHPGNFRIMPDGRLGVVDFGAVARLPDGLPESMGRLLRLVVDGDFEAVVAGLHDEGFLKRGVELDPDTIARYLGPFAEPARVERFTFSREWMREQMQRVSAPTAEGMGTAMKLNLPPQYLLIHRVWFGGIGVLSQLGATAPFRSIVEESLPGFAEA
ncbi:putative unusual protein kinase regulating ubiquinone biosynthesis (AarF/ABC1/UbiB family) [Aeromicrobium panaciterrae]|uniref:Unusual protein kinase regulating ubiquinone biosynthesis (AarF/ABC1/UbiB family) n=1 Tax=Aeromicrobium panaciterrae TaxID=363861 RepID=A0ABU1UM84_9ACTN|nr:AarF/ABC1/UbiB kinase family protein [Aeromicrobium panaciterrae]MDR7086288.1 putative unusual protein kinase regulating ubiquinone biosynthesis (AarF/ABC1/UbiB family) [Aeromicrobium panaciterrae]